MKAYNPDFEHNIQIVRETTGGNFDAFIEVTFIHFLNHTIIFSHFRDSKQRALQFEFGWTKMAVKV